MNDEAKRGTKKKTEIHQENERTLTSSVMSIECERNYVVIALHVVIKVIFETPVLICANDDKIIEILCQSNISKTHGHMTANRIMDVCHDR